MSPKRRLLSNLDAYQQPARLVVLDIHRFFSLDIPIPFDLVNHCCCLCPFIFSETSGEYKSCKLLSSPFWFVYSVCIATLTRLIIGHVPVMMGASLIMTGKWILTLHIEFYDDQPVDVTPSPA
jgi:hypothetical protein